MVKKLESRLSLWHLEMKKCPFLEQRSLDLSLVGCAGLVRAYQWSWCPGFSVLVVTAVLLCWTKALALVPSH